MSAPGVVVVHDRDGLTAQVRDLGDELAASGLSVEVVDLSADAAASDQADPPDPAGPPDPARPGDAPDGPAALATVIEAGRRLRSAGAVVVGAVGFARGGSLVLRAAALGDVDAVVAYDAVGAPSDAVTTACPVQLHLATADSPQVPDEAAAYVAALEAAGTPVDTFTYATTSGAPARTDGAGDAAVEAARSRTIGFLHARLAG